ncbi:hypothetical protein AB9K34_05590 [Sedimentitalea sp. XS_ASV28]|uniref:hypothetical protein n=1 Tax=Sedimentitalea sp. XS_ASV28 TaxID=3241296 RepID=UPI0035182D53
MARRIKREFPGVTAYFDRHQKRRYRFRQKGFSSEIHGEYGSDNFRRNYKRSIRGYRSQEIGATATKRGTIMVITICQKPSLIKFP